MHTITWAPGSDEKHDRLFHALRELNFKNKNHRFWKNYEASQFNNAIAYTIYFNDNNVPELCSSVVYKNCWPKGAYRVLNRTWKPNSKKLFFSREVNRHFGLVIQSQLKFLKENVSDVKLTFISRQTNNWEDFVIHYFKQFDLNFNKIDKKFLTCSNEIDSSCWQKIIYMGDDNLLDVWKNQNV